MASYSLHSLNEMYPSLVGKGYAEIIRELQRFPERPLSKRSILSQAIYAGDRNTAYAWALRFLQISPYMTFGRNVNGERIPLDSYSARIKLRTLINDLAPKVAALKAAEAKGEHEVREIPVPAPKAPKAEPKGTVHSLKAWLDRMRKWCDERNADGQAIDEVGMRPYEDGAKMFKAGIPEAAIKHAATMHYPAEARRALSVSDYDVTSYGEAEAGQHKAMPYVKALAETRKIDGKCVPIALVGPKGTGKTTLAAQLAKSLGLDFGMVSMTNGTSPSAFYGRPKIGGDGGVVESQFVKIYRDGGVFLFDEMDAANENLLLIVNAALANGHFSNAATGEMITRHPDFIPVCGMNTLGTGADRKYTGRTKLDAAALDRWNMGRVQVRFDENLAHSIFDKIVG